MGKRPFEALFRVDEPSPIGRSPSLWNDIELLLRVEEGDHRNKHVSLLRLLATKYYDERFVGSPPEFRVVGGESEASLADRINQLYEDAKLYYGGQSKTTPTLLEGGIDLKPRTLAKVVRLLQSCSLLGTDGKTIQEFYMRFAPSSLKKGLSQYYTPKEIVDFMVGMVPIASNAYYIDPCSGAGDFMACLLRKARNTKGNNHDIDRGVFCWDIDGNATLLAHINMMLNGDGLSTIETKNSLSEVDASNGLFDYVLTNPPFGERTKLEDNNILSQYELGARQSGKLFIERSLNLLKKEGVLLIVLPVGYLENPSDRPLREFLLKKTRVLACIELPEGVFKGAGAGGRTAVVVLQKGFVGEGNYNVFMDSALWVGFDHRSDRLKPMYERELGTGAILHDESNKPKFRNDLVAVGRRFASFCRNNNLTAMDRAGEGDDDYSEMSMDEVRKDSFLRFRVQKALKPYKDVLVRLAGQETFTLEGIGAEVFNKKNTEFESSKAYTYLETGSVFRNLVLKQTTMRGWELPNRAKLLVRKDDLLISKMKGSFDNFVYVLARHAGIVASNGFYCVRIGDRRHRYSFLRFLFSPGYKTQMDALATGMIMSDVKQQDLMTELLIPLTEDVGEVEAYLKAQDGFYGQSLV